MIVDRLVSIILILFYNERVGAQELAKLFKVSARTIYRDIDKINISGIHIRSIPGLGGGFEMIHEYVMDEKFFSYTDLSTILMINSCLSNTMRGNNRNNTFATIKKYVPASKAKEIKAKANQIKFFLNVWASNKDLQPCLKQIQNAILKKRLLSFDYTDRYGNKTTRTIEPYQLVLRNSHWYWRGYCYTRNDYRSFKISRASNLCIHETLFIARKDHDATSDFTDIPTSIQSIIKIRIHQSVMDQVLDYCSLEDLSPDGNDHYIVHFPFIENDYYYNILFSFGDRCECIEPLHVRAEMKRRIHDIATLYK